MCILRTSDRTAAPASFCAEQFSASTRSAALLLLILSLLAAISILFAPGVQGQKAHFAGTRLAPASLQAGYGASGNLIRGSQPILVSMSVSNQPLLR